MASPGVTGAHDGMYSRCVEANPNCIGGDKCDVAVVNVI